MPQFCPTSQWVMPLAVSAVWPIPLTGPMGKDGGFCSFHPLGYFLDESPMEFFIPWGFKIGVAPIKATHGIVSVPVVEVNLLPNSRPRWPHWVEGVVSGAVLFDAPCFEEWLHTLKSRENLWIGVCTATVR